MNSDYKRVPWFIVSTGIVILIGHYVDIFVMIMPCKQINNVVQPGKLIEWITL